MEMPEQWILFLQERWWLVGIAALALLIVIKIVQTMLKWVLAAVIVGAVLFYGANYSDELAAMGDEMINGAKEQAFQTFVSQAFDAAYESNEDGTYSVYTDNVRVEGREGESEVKVYWKDVLIGTFPIDDTIAAFIQRADRNG